jgi:hypothetical protein
VHLRPAYFPDHTQTSTRNRGFDISAVRLGGELLRPWLDRSGGDILGMVKIAGTDVGSEQHEADAIGVAGLHRLNRVRV